MLVNIDGRSLSQGDIVIDVPFFIIPKSITVALHGEKGKQACSPSDLESFRNMKERASGAKKGMLAVEIPLEVDVGMIVTQDCDLDNKDAISIARLHPLSAYAVPLKDAIELDEPLVVFDFKRRITEGPDYAHLVYVGKAVDETILCAEIQRIHTFPKKGWYEYFKSKRIKHLNDNGRKYLQGRLASFAGRYATDVGFWHTDEDKTCAEQVANDRMLIKQAHDRLEIKKQAKRTSLSPLLNPS